MITWKEYVEESAKTSIYDKWANNYEDSPTLEDIIGATYPVLGLLGELGEYAEILQHEDPFELELMKEVGDIFWYVADLSRRYNIDLDIFVLNDTQLPIINIVDFHDILIQASLMGNVAKKVVRDNSGNITDSYKFKMRPHLLYVFMNLQAYIYQVWDDGIFEEILQMNLDKLFSRQERGVLGGDGDNR